MSSFESALFGWLTFDIAFGINDLGRLFGLPILWSDLR